MSNFYTEPFVSAGEMEFPARPYITAQPQNHTATGPETYVLKVIAAGAVSYQWEVYNGISWAAIPGATSDTLTITIDPSMDGWRYRVIVTGADGSTVVSKAAQIAVRGMHEHVLGGAIVTFNGPAEIRSLEVDINAVQSGSGDPSPDNIRPISGWDVVPVTRTGKNLFDKSGVTNGYYLNSAGTPVSSSAFCYSDYIPVNGVYHYSGATGFGTAPNTCYYDINRNFISGEHWTTVEGTKTPPTRAKWMRVSVRVTDKDTFMLEYGSTASTYESFGTTYPITLPQTVYGGKIKDGVLTVDKTIVDLGTLNWSIDVRSYQTALTNSDSRLSDALYDATTPIWICSNYKSVTLNSASSTEDYYVWIDSNGRVRVKDTSLNNATASEFKSAMSGVYLVYELATPIEITLSDYPTITTLRGVNNLWADSGDISVTVII